MPQLDRYLGNAIIPPGTLHPGTLPTTTPEVVKPDEKNYDLFFGYQYIYGMDKYTHKYNPRKHEDTTISFTRYMAGLKYPIGPLRFTTWAGAEEVNIHYFSDNFEEVADENDDVKFSMDLDVRAKSYPTLFIGQRVELKFIDSNDKGAIINTGNLFSLLDFEFNIFVQAEGAIAPRSVKANRLQLTAKGASKDMAVDLMDLSKDYVNGFEYQMTRFDIGAAFLINQWKYFKPHIALAYLSLMTSLFIDYKDGARAELEEMGVNDKSLIRGRLDFNKSAGYMIFGFRSQPFDWLTFSAEGSRIQINHTEIYTLQASLGYSF